MSNGDDESTEPDEDEEESAGAADQPSAEKAGAAESDLGSDDETPTAKEIAAEEDMESDDREDEETADDATDEPATESDEDVQPDDESAAETADEAAVSGDDAEVEPPDDGTEDESADDETETSGDEESDDTEDDERASESDEDDSAGDEGTEDDAADDDGESDSEEEESEEGADEETEDEGDETADGDEESTESDADEPTEHTVDSLEDRLDTIETDIEEAETEADLDTAEADLDSVEADLEAADLPEPDDDEEDEDEASPREELESHSTELREAVESQRGPYAEEIIEQIESAQTTVSETHWTEQGEREMVETVETFLDDAGETLDEEFAVERGAGGDERHNGADGGVESDDSEDDGDDEDDNASDGDEYPTLVAALSDVIEEIEARNLDPDEDEATIAALLESAEALTDGLDDAEEWDDLTVREKLAAEGFYDVLTADNRKDFPPEWNAVKIYEKQHEPEPILRGLEMFGSEFMEEHCIESLKRMGSPEAFDAMEQRAQRRDKLPIEALGKIGDDRALDTLHEYIEGESDPGLQKVTLKAIGEIGSEESTQPVADRLVAENETVRSNAARALGLIGDTRAISPLSDALADDDSNSVRASAAWALNRIGTERALDAASEHADDRSFLVQSEAEKAERALTDEAEGDATEKAA